jgi:heat shock protein HslJ
MRLIQIGTFGLIIILFSNCSSTEKMNKLGILTSNTWELSSLRGEDVDQIKFPDGLPLLSFLEGGKLAGFAGCNNFSGGFLLEGPSLKLDPGAMTRKACQGTSEDEFIAAMSKVKNIKAGKDKLTLLDGTKEIMRLIPKSE